jgi:hypothetical protein
MEIPAKTSYLLATLFCTLIIASTFGSSFAIRNSFAQAQQQLQQIQQAPTVAYKSPWNNNMPISSVDSSQPLCAAGFCNPSWNPASTTTQPQSSATKSTTNVAIKLSNTKTNTNGKVLTISHSFVSSKVIGPDRFRFVTSYWTTSDVSRLIDAGRSAGNVSSQFTGGSNYAAPTVSPIGPAIISHFPLAGFAGTSAFPQSPIITSGQGGGLPLSNLQTEVDKGEGYSTLAVVLQYEGVVNLAGITAALKLPIGFQAEYPLTDDRNNFDIAISNYDGGIRPSQEVVLYFPLDVLPTAKVQTPVLGPLALHFLRSAPRSVEDSLDSSEQNMLAKALSGMNTNATGFPTGITAPATGPSTTSTTTSTSSPSSTSSTTSTTTGINLLPSANATTLTANFNDNLNFARNNINHFARFIPYTFVDQVIPVIFKATGREVLDVYQACSDVACDIRTVSANGVAVSNV